MNFKSAKSVAIVMLIQLSMVIGRYLLVKVNQSGNQNSESAMNGPKNGIAFAPSRGHMNLDVLFLTIYEFYFHFSMVLI